MGSSWMDLSREGGLAVGSDDAYASLGYSTTVDFDICHGLDLNLQASAAGEAGVSQQILDYLRATIEIEAGVESGVRLAAKISPSILNEIGMVASVQAYLKAYVQASLELSLTLEKIIQGVRHETDHPTYLIFRDFAERLEIGVGVQANAQISVTAAAEVVCQGRLVADRSKHEKPGFDMRMNAEAGFLFGAGIDFFAMGRLDNLTDFFRNTKDTLLQEIRGEAQAKTDLGERQLDLIFQAWSTAIDLIIDGSLDTESPYQAITDSARNFTTQFVMDEILDAYGRLLDTLFEQALQALEQSTGLSQEDLDNVLLAIQDVESRLPQVSHFHDLLPVFDNINAIYQALQLPGLDIVQEAITHIYLLGYLLDEQHQSEYQDLPSYVQARYTDATSQNLSRLDDPQQAYLYLENGCFSDWFRDYSGIDNGPVGELLDVLAANNISIAGCIHLLLDDDPSNSPQLVNLTLNLLEALFNQHVTPAIENLIKPVLDDTALGANYYECVLENTIHSFPTLFITLLRDYISEPGDKQKIEQLRYICNRYLLTLFSKNVSFFCGQLLTFSADNVSDSVRTTSRNIRYGRFRHMAEGMFDKLEDRINSFLPLPVQVEIDQDSMNDLIEATEDFLLEILAAADRGMGRGTWTPARIHKLTSAIEGVLLNPDDDHLNFQSLDAAMLQQTIRRIADCSFLPDGNLESLNELMEVMSVIGLKQFKEFLISIPVDTAVYFARVLKILLVHLIEEILEFIEDILEGAKAALEAALEALADLINEIEEAIQDLLNEMEDLLDTLYDETLGALEDFFEGLLDELDFADLNWLEDFLEWLGGVFGGDSSEDDARNALHELKRQALNNLDQDAFKAALRIQVTAGDYDNQALNNWIHDHLLTPDIHGQLNKMSFKTYDAVGRMKMTAFETVFTNSRELAENSYWQSRKQNALNRNRSKVSTKQRELNRLRARDNAINDLRLSDIRINSPLMVDALKDDLPLYGEHVLIDIDFDQVDIRKVIADQISIVTADLQDPANGRLDTSLVKSGVRATPNLGATSPLNLKILVNGQELPLDQVEVTGNRLSMHLGRPLIHKGQNDLYVVLAAPTGRAESFVAYRQFMCDDDAQKRRSNTVYIDPERTVIETRSNDHDAATRESQQDKEKVVITNAGDQAVDLEGWQLSDGAGHRYTFRAVGLKPNSSYTLYVGKTPSGGDGWIGYYGGHMIALLNNRGEFLKLTDSSGKVVSQLYTGNPDSNDDIRIYRGAKQ